MYILLADNQVNACNCQHDGEENNRRCRSEGRIAARIAVEHIVDIAYDGVHLSRIQVCAEKGDSMPIAQSNISAGEETEIIINEKGEIIDERIRNDLPR